MLVIAVISLSAAILLNAVEIFRRFISSKSIYWIQDATLLCMMWFIFPGMVTISYRNADVFVDIFINRFSANVKQHILILNDILVTLLCTVLFWYSIKLMILRIGKSMLTSEIPYFWYTLAMVLVFLLLALIYLGKVLGAFAAQNEKGGKNG